MGTNYYLTQNICPHCGRGDEPKHIGKSSGGWCFSLHVYPDEGIHDLSDWLPLLEAPGATIKNEYGDMVTVKDMLDIIRDRSWPEPENGIPYGYESMEQFCRMNSAAPGPNGLMRHRVEGSPNATRRESFTNGCIRHGEGTWDCIVGEFG